MRATKTSCFLMGLLFFFSINSWAFNLDGGLIDFERTFNKLNPRILSGYKTVVIIPKEGCGGCINDATAYLQRNIEEYKGAIVFTGIGDPKIFKNLLGHTFLQRKNVYMDHENLLMMPSVSSIYPQIVSISNSKVVKVVPFNAKLIAKTF